MSNLGAYKPEGSSYDFSKGPKEIYNAIGDEGLFDVVLNIPQDDQDDEWGGTLRIALERIADEVGSLRLIVKDPLNSGKQGLQNIVGLMSRVVTIGASPTSDSIKVGTATLSQSGLSFGSGATSPYISTGSSHTLRVIVGSATYSFGATGYTLPGVATSLSTKRIRLYDSNDILFLDSSSTDLILKTAKLVVGGDHDGSTYSGMLDNFSVDFDGSVRTAGMLTFDNTVAAATLISGSYGNTGIAEEARIGIATDNINLRHQLGDINPIIRYSNLSAGELVIFGQGPSGSGQECTYDEVGLQSDTGSIGMRARDGDIFLVNESVRGNISLSSTSGDIILKTYEADGDIYLLSDSNVLITSRENIGISSDDGDISISSLGSFGNINLLTSSGEINVSSHGSVSINSNSGDLNLGTSGESGNVYIHTTAGDINIGTEGVDACLRIHNVDGSIYISTGSEDGHIYIGPKNNSYSNKVYTRFSSRGVKFLNGLPRLDYTPGSDYLQLEQNCLYVDSSGFVKMTLS